MPYRIFADDQGNSWEIWEVRPTSAERRALDRRAKAEAAWTGPERRADANRRQRLSGRLDSAHPLAHGWLAFRSDGEKRRLAPIPPDWETFHGRELRELWEKAQVTASRIKESA